MTVAAGPQPEPDPNPATPAMRAADEQRQRAGYRLPPGGALASRVKWLPLSGRVAPWRPRVLCWRRRFAGTPDQVSAARQFTRFLLADSSAAIDAAWVTGELATNAIRHSRSGQQGGVFTVEVMRWRHHLQIQLTDAGGDGAPALPAADPAAAISNGGQPPEGGLGLYGIGALACRFGTHQNLDGSRVLPSAC